jgi:membrane glycosyltransferase
MILDPYANAIHVSLLRQMQSTPSYVRPIAKLAAEGWDPRALGERLLMKGSEALQPEERRFVLSDLETMAWLHQQAWKRSDETLAAELRDLLQPPQRTDD